MQDEAPATMSYSAHLEYLFNDVYYPFIIEHVKFDEVLTKVECMRKHAGEILAKRNNDGAKAAAIRFMELLKKTPDEGNNYQQLLQALKELDYNIVVRAIEKGEIKYQQEEHKKLVSLFWDRLQDQVDAVEVAMLLLEKNVISFAQEKSIRVTAAKDPSGAVFQLIDDIPRKNEQWFRHFWEALYLLEKHELCQLLSPDWYRKRNTGEPLDDGVYFEPIGLQSGMQDKDTDIPLNNIAPSCQPGQRCECVAEIKNLKEQVDVLSNKLDEVLSILKSSRH